MACKQKGSVSGKRRMLKGGEERRKFLGPEQPVNHLTRQYVEKKTYSIMKGKRGFAHLRRDRSAIRRCMKGRGWWAMVEMLSLGSVANAHDMGGKIGAIGVGGGGEKKNCDGCKSSSNKWRKVKPKIKGQLMKSRGHEASFRTGGKREGQGESHRYWRGQKSLW